MITTKTKREQQINSKFWVKLCRLETEISNMFCQDSDKKAMLHTLFRVEEAL